MPQPRDYAEGFDPYKTDPLYVQHLREQDVDQPCHPDDPGDESQQHEVPEIASHDRPERVIRKRAPELSQPSHGNSMFKELLDFFIPPLNDQLERVRRWRISVGLSLLVLFLNLTLSYGWYQIFGFSGFAYASTVKDIKVGLLEQRIFDARVNQCEGKTPESRRFFRQKLAELMREYQMETETPYPLPSCRELGSGPPNDDS